MNRQQRRLMRKHLENRYDFEERYAAEIRERQNHVNDRFIEIYVVCIALAVHNLYGWKARGIGRVIREFNRLICRIGEEGTTFDELNRELLDKTGVQFRLEDFHE